MLQIAHRESRDIDIFLPDPQQLALLDPEKRDLRFEVKPNGYFGDGAKFLKFVFEHLGEIDFIVAGPLTSNPAAKRVLEGVELLLDSVPEIIAKKIHYRGSSIKPRDIFDIAAAGEAHADAIVRGLKDYRDEVLATLSVIEDLNPDFVAEAIQQLVIKPPYDALAQTARERAREILRAVS